MATLVRDEVCDPLIRLFRLWWKTLSRRAIGIEMDEREWLSGTTNEQNPLILAPRKLTA